MADSFTGNYSFTQPEVGSSTDTWGGKLNTNWGNLDTFLNQFVGMVAMFSATGTIDGWLKCNGQTVSRTTYERLWNFANLTGQVAATEGGKLPGEFGPGDGSTDFSLPDLRGYFVRAWDDGAGVDTSRTFGDVQSDQNKDHGHVVNETAAGGHTHVASTGNAGNHNHGGQSGSNGAHNHTLNRQSGDLNDTGGSTSRLTRATRTTGLNESVDTAPNHVHTISTDGDHSHTVTVDTVVDHNHSVSVDNSGGDEVRVKNIALTYYIRY